MKKNFNQVLFSITLTRAIACLFLGAIVCSTFSTYADTGTIQVNESSRQDRTISGQVIDTSGEAIIGASVLVKGTTKGSITDADGNFEIPNVPANATLQVSYIGYKTQEIVLSGQSRLVVTLLEDNELLDEVVVVGYGTQKKATLTGSVSQVGGDELKKVAATNLSNTLAGKTAGIIANTRSGEPGEDTADILIRGKGTMGDTSPLIVVDGIADRSFSRLNPEDIESISVLKDASAAIYGARAANGVILVTTKRGKEGKVRFNYSGNYALSQPTRVPKVLDAYQYATYINEYDAGHGNAPTYSTDALQKIQNGSDPIRYANTNWWKEVTRDWATKTEHSLSVSGGTEKVSFYSSAQYMYQDAIYKNSPQNYNQYQFTTNIDAKITNAVKFSMDILGRQEVRNRPYYSTEDLFTYFLIADPMAAPYYPNGLPRIGYDGVANNTVIKVTDKAGKSKSTYTTINLKPRVRIDLDKLTKGLYFEGYAAMDFHFNDGKTLKTPFDVYIYDSDTDTYNNRRDATGSISVTQWFSKDKTITLNARLGYTHDFEGGHHVDAFVAYEQSKYDYTTINAYRGNYLSSVIPEIFAGSDVPEDKDNGGYSTASARQNYFGRINYAYKDRYLAEMTMRYDGSMNFAPGHRWGLFPAFSAGWIISEENFFEPIKDYVSFLKLKGSWGMMGNDNISAYQYMSQYKFVEPNWDDLWNMTFGDNIVKLIDESRTANPLVTWEKAKTWNVGVSSQFLNGMFGLDFDYFQSSRDDILITRNASIPAYSGLSLPAENLGKVDNHGLEVIATYRDNAGDFNWSVTGNFTYAKNKVVFMDEATNIPDWQRSTGRPLDGYLVYKAKGIYQTQAEVDGTPHLAGAQPGDLIYEDVNGDGNISEDDKVRIDKSPTPKIIYGLTLSGGWKGLDLNIFFQGQGCATQMLQPTMNMATDFYEGRWIEGAPANQNANARWPRACIKQTYLDTTNGPASTWWLRNAAFLRLKSLEVGYTFPKALIGKIGLENLRIYANGNNLFSIDHMKVCDPEAAMFHNNDGWTVESNGVKGYPLQRMITFGANISF